MIEAVLFDRDGTLAVDRPTAHPDDALVAISGVREALDRLRARGLRIGVVTNQPRVGNQAITREQLDRSHARLEEVIGGIDAWFVCPHRETAGCGCRKPQPGLVIEAAARFGVPLARCVVVGDIGSDVEAAHRAGAPAILVPTPVTLREEIDAAPMVRDSIGDAVTAILDGHLDTHGLAVNAR